MSRVDSAVVQACEVLGITAEEISAGTTLRELFRDCQDQPGVTVWWGLWTDEELETVI